MTISMGARVDQWMPILKVDGVPDIICQSKSGGAADSEETRTRPGGGMAEISLGGRRMLENVTVTVSMSAVTPATYRLLRSRAGRAHAWVSEVPLDADGVAFGAEALVASGTLKRVGGIDTDANGTDGSTFEVEVVATLDSAGGGV